MEKLIKNGVTVTLVNDIYTVDNLAPGDYDSKAAFYDKVISNKCYNMLMWGNKPQNYMEFAEKSLSQRDKGLVLDIGCGTLSFTHGVYKNSRIEKREIYLCDLSEGMLSIARNRLGTRANIKFLRANALDFPFKDETARTILSFGFLHVVDSIELAIKEFWRLLERGGDLHVSCLCADRKISARYLSFLKKRGIVSHILKSQDILRLFLDAGFDATVNVTGAMAYIDAVKT